MAGRSNQRRLEREYDQASRQAIAASMRGDLATAAMHSDLALDASRQLYGEAPDPHRHRPALAAALYNHAGHLRRAGKNTEALRLLTESAEHYRQLAIQDPAEYQVRSIDVAVRTGLTLRSTGDEAGAAARFREAVEAYSRAPATDPVERDLGLARAHFHLGRSLLVLATSQEALGEIDKGLFIVERVRQEAGVREVTDYSWLGNAPQSFRLIAPDWIAAATCAMELHNAAGRFSVAADAGNIAVRVSAGMAALGGASYAALYQAVLAKAQIIWQQAENPVSTALDRASPGQEVVIGGGNVLFATPDIEAVLRATGWVE
jgi:tetratricopeptide (TPR) repeat protein